MATWFIGVAQMTKCACLDIEFFSVLLAELSLPAAKPCKTVRETYGTQTGLDMDLSNFSIYSLC